MVNPGPRPTVQLKLVDTDHLYYSWRWEHDLGAIQNIMVPGESVWPVLGELAAALPTPLPGETVDQALERALTGPFMDREREIELTTALAHALIPHQLAQEMNALLEAGTPRRTCASNPRMPRRRCLGRHCMWTRTSGG